MEKETVLILLLLKPMTKTSQLNDIAIMIYHGGFPVLKNINSSFFATILMKITWKTKMKKRLYYYGIETNNKDKSTKWKIQGRCFQAPTQSQMAFQDGGLKLSFRGL